MAHGGHAGVSGTWFTATGKLRNRAMIACAALAPSPCWRGAAWVAPH
jgi:hypothetical protein